VAISKNSVLNSGQFARRKALLELARLRLPEDAQQRLILHDDCLPDSSAAAVYDELIQLGVSVDPLLKPHNTTSCVFHEQSLLADGMEILYQAGFRDINCLNEDDYTPVMYPYPWLRHQIQLVGTIERAEWLITKGARLDVPRLAKTGSRPCHFVSLYLTKAIIVHHIYSVTFERFYTAPAFERLPYYLRRHRGFLMQVLGTDYNEDCNCFCSLTGCTPLSVMLHLLLCINWSFLRKGDHGSIQERCEILEIIINELPENAAIANEVIRLITFFDLGLTHTCCRDESINRPFAARLCPFRYKDDVDEIHDEEKDLIEEFENLVAELQNEHLHLGLPLWGFIRSHWSSRVKRYLIENGEYLNTGQLLCAHVETEIVEG
jgi:hypothetical protein